MATFKIPVVWTMMGYRVVEAESLAKACEQVMTDDEPLPEANFLDESFGLDLEGVRDQVKTDKDLVAFNALNPNWFK